MSHSQEFLQRGLIFTSRFRRTLFVFFCFALVLWAGAVVFAAVTVFDKTLAARDALLASKSAAIDFDFDNAQVSLSRAQQSLNDAALLLPLLDSVAWFPGMGSQLRLTTDIIRTQREIVRALSPIYDLGEDVVSLSGWSAQSTVTFEELPAETKRAVLLRLAGAVDDFDLLATNVDLAQSELALLSRQASIGPIMDALDPLRDHLNDVAVKLETVRTAAHLLPAFAGLENPTTNLLLFLNNDELRPGGGFIGSYGVLVVDSGDIASLKTADVYTLDDAVAPKIDRVPPAPLTSHNAATKWFFRDANWSPDFRVSASQAVEMFLAESAIVDPASSIPTADHIDNVIALTPTFASDLLAITGPITVGQQTFTQENVAEALEYQVEYGYEAAGQHYAQRKEILADLVSEMKKRLYSIPATQWERVLAATKDALREKQLLLYSSDEDVERMIEKVGWGGAISPATADAIIVVDANLASLKSDPVVDRHITYAIDEHDGDWVGRVEVTYVHRGTFDWKTTRYRTYTRVLVPAGSVAIGSVDVSEEGGMLSMGKFTNVEPGASGTLSFEFELAPAVVEAIEEGEYDLTVIKQAGARNHALTLDLEFDKNVARASPPEDQNEWGDARYRLNTILDQDFVVNVQ